MNFTQNSKCPCGSAKKYKQCCMIYHKGAKAPNALALMKSRYSAYAVGDVSYIIKTTHKDNPSFNEDKLTWSKDILEFCKSSEFFGLEILEFINGNDTAFVTFKALLSNGVLLEKSGFLKTENGWLYVSGEFLTV